MGDILALLGDIGLPLLPADEALLQRQTQRFEHSLVLSANHKYYTSERRPPSRRSMPILQDQRCVNHSGVTVGGEQWHIECET